jgi:hypothetical protein
VAPAGSIGTDGFPARPVLVGRLLRGCILFGLLGCCDAFLRLLAGLGLGRVVAGFAGHQAGIGQEAGDTVGRQRALAHPVLDALLVELHALGILGQHRVPGAQLLDEATVARRAHVGDHDLVVGALLGARTGQTDFQCHGFFLSMMAIKPA